jgi:hypothetical protein
LVFGLISLINNACLLALAFTLRTPSVTCPLGFDGLALHPSVINGDTGLILS